MAWIFFRVSEGLPSHLGLGSALSRTGRTQGTHPGPHAMLGERDVFRIQFDAEKPTAVRESDDAGRTAARERI